MMDGLGAGKKVVEWGRLASRRTMSIPTPDQGRLNLVGPCWDCDDDRI